MGCGSSKGGTPKDLKVSEARRRLSIGAVDESSAGGSEEAAVSEEDRGMITGLNTQTIIDMLKAPAEQGGGRKMSIGSNTDEGKTSFANKTMQQIGDAIDPADMCLGYTCRKGLKPESPNQDSWFVLSFENNYSIYGVFDGHGQKGHDVSNFVKEALPKLIVKDSRFQTPEMADLLKDSFKKTQTLIAEAERLKKLSAMMSGTTASVVVHDHKEKKIMVSHVADSTVVLGKKPKGGGPMIAEKLTEDHKPNLKEEKKRIERAGGRVVFDGYANHRIYAKNARYPGLNMSRCLGDLMGHNECGITAEPEVLDHKLSEDDYVLLLCSDGVWEFIAPEEAVEIVTKHPPNKAMAAAESLAKEAWDRWIKEEGGAVVDDITVVLVYLS